MNATQYYESAHPLSHTLPKTAVVDLMEKYWLYRKDLYEKARSEFNAEAWMASHNLEEVRKRFKNEKRKDD